MPRCSFEIKFPIGGGFQAYLMQCAEAKPCTKQQLDLPLFHHNTSL